MTNTALSEKYLSSNLLSLCLPLVARLLRTTRIMNVVTPVDAAKEVAFLDCESIEL